MLPSIPISTGFLPAFTFMFLKIIFVLPFLGLPVLDLSYILPDQSSTVRSTCFVYIIKREKNIMGVIVVSHQL